MQTKRIGKLKNNAPVVDIATKRVINVVDGVIKNPVLNVGNGIDEIIP